MILVNRGSSGWRFREGTLLNFFWVEDIHALTFYGVGLGELGAVLEDVLGEIIPLLVRGEAEIYVRGGEVIGMELHVAGRGSAVLCKKPSFAQELCT